MPKPSWRLLWFVATFIIDEIYIDVVYATPQDGRSKFDLEDVDGRTSATVEIEARYVPVPVKLEPRESINSECFRCLA